MIEGMSKASQMAFEALEKLELDEKLTLLAVLFEHWDNELINDGNYIKPEDAYERNKAVFTPMDLGLNNIKDLAECFKTLSQLSLVDNEHETNETQFPDVIESQVHQTSGVKSALTSFYRLSFKNKLDYFAELLAQLEAGELLAGIPIPNSDLGINGYELAGKIITYREMLSNEAGNKTDEDLPFDLA